MQLTTQLLDNEILSLKHQEMDVLRALHTIRGAIQAIEQLKKLAQQPDVAGEQPAAPIISESEADHG